MRCQTDSNTDSKNLACGIFCTSEIFSTFMPLLHVSLGVGPHWCYSGPLEVALPPFWKVVLIVTQGSLQSQL